MNMPNIDSAWAAFELLQSSSDKGFLPIIGLLLLAWYFVHLYSMFININDPIPYGAFIPFFGCTFQLLWDANAYLRTCTPRNGVYNLYVLGRIVTVIASEVHLNTVYKKFEFYHALDDFQVNRILGERALPFKMHQFLHVLRKGLVPRFFEAPMYLYNPMVVEFEKQETALGFHRHHHRFVVDDLYTLLLRVIFVMNTNVTMGTKLGADQEFIDDLCEWSRRALDVMRKPSVLGIMARRRCDQTRKRLCHRLEAELRMVLEDLDNPHAFSEDDQLGLMRQLLLETRDDPEWSIDACAEKLLGLLYGTVANTPMVAVNTLMYILRDRSDVLERVQEEVNLAYHIGGGAMTPNGVLSMTFTEFCIEEALRLIGPPMHVRKTTRDTTLPGTTVTIPNNRLVLVPMAIFHRSKKSFPGDPELFRPDRFRRQQDQTRLRRRRSSVSSVHPSLLSWGRGQHHCLGRQLAITEIKMTLAYLLHNFDMQPKNPARDERILFLTNGSSLFKDRSIAMRRHRGKLPDSVLHHRRSSSWAA